MSIYDTQQPMSYPAPVLAQTQTATDPKMMMLARMLSQSNGGQAQPGALGGLDKVAKMALQGYAQSKAIEKQEPVQAPPTKTMGEYGSAGFGDQSAALGTNEFGPVGVTAYDPGMSRPGYGGFGSEMGREMPLDMAQAQGMARGGMANIPDMAQIGAAQSLPKPMPGAGAGAKIICTELHRQGMMSDRIYAADQIFGKAMAINHPEVMRGYHRLAAPVVGLMQRSRIFSRVMGSLVSPWARHMAYLVGADEKGSITGMLMMIAGCAVCRLFGRPAPVTAEA